MGNDILYKKAKKLAQTFQSQYAISSIQDNLIADVCAFMLEQPSSPVKSLESAEEALKEFHKKEVYLTPREEYCFTEGFALHSNSKEVTEEDIFNRAMKIHNTTKGKGFIEGAKWALNLPE